MKVTAIIPSDFINEVKNLMNGKNINDSLIIALKDWVELQHIRKLNEKVSRNPLKFNVNFNAENIHLVGQLLVPAECSPNTLIFL